MLAIKELESHLGKLDNEKKDLIQKEPCCSVSLSFQAPSVPQNDILVVHFIQVNYHGCNRMKNFLIWDQQHLLILHCSHCDLQRDLAEVRKSTQERRFFTSYVDVLYSTEDMNDCLRDSYFLLVRAKMDQQRQG